MPKTSKHSWSLDHGSRDLVGLSVHPDSDDLLLCLWAQVDDLCARGQCTHGTLHAPGSPPKVWGRAGGLLRGMEAWMASCLLGPRWQVVPLPPRLYLHRPGTYSQGRWPQHFCEFVAQVSCWAPKNLLGGSRVVISRVISPLTRVTIATSYNYSYPTL